MMDEIPEPIKKSALRGFLALLITSFMVPFITYDTGIRCVAHPCPEAAARGGLIEFLAKSNNFNAYIVDLPLFILSLFGVFLLFAVIDKLGER